jgi:hypothetical protein
MGCITEILKPWLRFKYLHQYNEDYDCKNKGLNNILSNSLSHFENFYLKPLCHQDYLQAFIERIMKVGRPQVQPKL